MINIKKIKILISCIPFFLALPAIIGFSFDGAILDVPVIGMIVGAGAFVSYVLFVSYLGRPFENLLTNLGLWKNSSGDWFDWPFITPLGYILIASVYAIGVYLIIELISAPYKKTPR